jgi:hypothetical protein
MHMVGNVGVERTGRGRDPGELVYVERHQQNGDGGNEKNDGAALARQPEYKGHGHDGRAGWCDKSYGLSQSLARRQCRGLQSIGGGCWRLWRGRGGGVYQLGRSIAKFHPLILASDGSGPVRLGPATHLTRTGERPAAFQFAEETATYFTGSLERRQYGNTN